MDSGFFSFASLDFNANIVKAATPQISYNTETLEYELPNYTVTYLIKKMPPPDSLSVDPFAYNLIVRGPPPYPIQVEFYQQNEDNITEKVTYIVKTSSISSTRGCTGYPTQITMKFVENDTINDPSNLISIDEQVTDTAPDIPEFFVRFVAYPYDVPEKNTTTVDQYTGKETVKITPGYRVENKSIEIVVKNQPFTPYSDEDGHEINLFYGVKVKGHYGDEWKSVSDISLNLGQESNVQYDSEYTVFSIDPTEYPSNAVLDFEVQALTGYYVPYGRITVIFGIDFYGQKSSWSQIQTYSLAETKFEVIPEFSSWIILPLFFVVTLIGVIIRNKNSKRV